jgi:hypothetical protein
MACAISCMISAVFLIGMVYFYYITDKTQIVQNYKATLSKENLAIFEKINHERMKQSYEGYALGVFLSILLLFYNIKFTRNKMRPSTMVCLVVATSFVTNYFYYTLSPKKDWMLSHVKTPEETAAWLQMYKGMKYNYHMGLALGIVAVGVMAFAFRC